MALMIINEATLIQLCPSLTSGYWIARVSRPLWCRPHRLHMRSTSVFCAGTNTTDSLCVSSLHYKCLFRVYYGMKIGMCSIKKTLLLSFFFNAWLSLIIVFVFSSVRFAWYSKVIQTWRVTAFTHCHLRSVCLHPHGLVIGWYLGECLYGVSLRYHVGYS